MSFFGIEIYNRDEDLSPGSMWDAIELMQGRYYIYLENTFEITALPFELPIEIPIPRIPVNIYDALITPEEIRLEIEVGETNPVALTIVAIVAGLGILFGGAYLVLNKIERVMEPRTMLPLLIMILIVVFAFIKIMGMRK